MIREKTNRPLIIDTTGSEGNAFVLLGYAKKLLLRIISILQNSSKKDAWSLAKH